MGVCNRDGTDVCFDVRVYCILSQDLPLFFIEFVVEGSSVFYPQIFKIYLRSWLLWCTAVISALWEAEAAGG